MYAYNNNKLSKITANTGVHGIFITTADVNATKGAKVIAETNSKITESKSGLFRKDLVTTITAMMIVFIQQYILLPYHICYSVHQH